MERRQSRSLHLVWHPRKCKSCPGNFKSCKTRVSYDLVIFRANVMGDALSRKEIVKSRRVSGMMLAAQSEAFKQENVLVERLHGLEEQMERKRDENLYFMDRIWVLLVGSVMDEAHASRYLVHPGADRRTITLETCTGSH
ncbi:hypothetical protein Tco_1100902, partial [Tanacetum coccineum]